MVFVATNNNISLAESCNDTSDSGKSELFGDQIDEGVGDMVNVNQLISKIFRIRIEIVKKPSLWRAFSSSVEE